MGIIVYAEFFLNKKVNSDLNVITNSISKNSKNAELSIATVGSGGAGAITTGTLLLEASAKEGCYGMLIRSVGPQIRGGEAAALLRLGAEPVNCVTDKFNVLVAMDWKNTDRFSTDIPLDIDSIIIADPEQGNVPDVINQSGAKIIEIPIGELAKKVKKGRANMISLGVIAELIDLPSDAVQEVLQKRLGSIGELALQSSLEAVVIGREAASGLEKFSLPVNSKDTTRWIITGNQATGLGAIKAGIRFVAAYPITPATEVLEWMSSVLNKTNGKLVQAEDELASVNMLIGASFGGVPSLTATSGPGLSLMMEGLGLAVSSETPIVVVDVMRVGPSTGIATKSEQSDLNIAVYGFHGDAPHIVVAPNSVSDCIFTAQWSVYLAEAMQTAVILLTDQYMGQAKTVINKPADIHYRAERQTISNPDEDYKRYAITENGISPMSIPGTAGGQYTAEGLEHNEKGNPSTTAEDHAKQMDKRLRKISNFEYGDHWADIEGEGELAVITWGSTTGSIREALYVLRDEGVNNIKLISIRLISPVQTDKFDVVLAGVRKILIVEQSHAAQFRHYLQTFYKLPDNIESYHRAGPLMFRPGEIISKLKSWSQS